MKDSCIEPLELDPIPLSYNPPIYGRAYYFTENGYKLRKFSIDEEKRDGKNYDDVPMSHEMCGKRFTRISAKG